jgi:predicted metalloprotease
VQIRSQAPVEKEVTFENQADCVAGAWLGYENSKGFFKGGVDDATVSAMSIMISDVESRSHGIDLERLLSFSKGETQGLSAECERALPSRMR